MVIVRAPDSSLCTGTLIAPTVVLTAAHCLAASVRNGLEGGDVGFGADVEALVATREIRTMFVLRRFTGEFADGFDIGLIRLVEPAPVGIEPVPWSAAQIDPSIVGFDVRAVGFGALSAVTGAGQGVKRTVELEITGMQGDLLSMGDPYRNTCQGDSGGPIFRLMGGVEQVIAVGSFGELGCRGITTKTRLDLYSDIIDEVVAAWDGPCADDGVCAESACAGFIDPDCDPCGLNGVCAEGCPQVDRDCPVGKLVGDPCDGPLECESRVCDPVRGTCAEPCVITQINACGDDRACVQAPPEAAPASLAGIDGPTLCRTNGGCAAAADGPANTAPWGLWLLLFLALLAGRRTRVCAENPVSIPGRG